MVVLPEFSATLLPGGILQFSEKGSNKGRQMTETEVDINAAEVIRMSLKKFRMNQCSSWPLRLLKSSGLCAAHRGAPRTNP